MAHFISKQHEVAQFAMEITEHSNTQMCGSLIINSVNKSMYPLLSSWASLLFILWFSLIILCKLVFIVPMGQKSMVADFTHHQRNLYFWRFLFRHDDVHVSGSSPQLIRLYTCFFNFYILTHFLLRERARIPCFIPLSWEWSEDTAWYWHGF